MAQFNVTYEIITTESAADGDVSERGFIGRGLSLREALATVTETRTRYVANRAYVELSDLCIAHARWITIYNGPEYHTGAQESRSLHFPACVTTSTRCRIARLLSMV